MTYYAHSLEDQPPEKWETMEQHEELVAEYCAKFLKRIHPMLESWGDLLGRWHDLGKYSNEFQTYLFKANDLLNQLPDIHRAETSGKVDHATAAAQLAVSSFDTKGKMLAYVFAGHHAGLPDWDDGSSQSGLLQRLMKNVANWKANTPDKLISSSFPGMPAFSKPEDAQTAAFRVSFFIRMIFSGLVDSDYLATEMFMSPARTIERQTNGVSMRQIADVLESKVWQLQADANETTVNSIRSRVGLACLDKAKLAPGFFSLSVPTGGGKTIASLRFALEHAITHKMDRVIFGVPFTSIIEQNAKVYRSIFDGLSPEIVLEHHSNLDPDSETNTNRLQAENWDASIVVTTNVQFFESLFACRTSRCRKLHRIAKSVIILDEAQTLPIELLKPTMMALKELVTTYGCSVVLCSATQPALSYREDFSIGLKEIRPIIDDPSGLHQSLKRVRVEVAGRLDDDELARQLDSCNQVLCIVNTRPHAASLFESLRQKDGAFHLSTRLCAAHRIEVMDEIRDRLNRKLSCRVISTQLIEAGVDVDFPVVYRASCGLDSLAQAAGRCNREGRLDSGRVVFFKGKKLPPPGFLRQSAYSTNELLSEFREDLLSPDAIKAYFELHYWKKSANWDQHKVLEPIGKRPSDIKFNFREIADRYRFIRDASETVLIPFEDEGTSLIGLLENPHFVHRNTWRKLQRYSVQVRQIEFAKLVDALAVEKKHERWVLTQGHLYDDQLGLLMGKVDGVLPVKDLVL